MCVLAAATSPHGRDQQGMLYRTLMATTVEHLALINSQGSADWGEELWHAMAEAAGSPGLVAGALQYCQFKLDEALIRNIKELGIERSNCVSETLTRVDYCTMRAPAAGRRCVFAQPVTMRAAELMLLHRALHAAN